MRQRDEKRDRDRESQRDNSDNIHPPSIVCERTHFPADFTTAIDLTRHTATKHKTFSFRTELSSRYTTAIIYGVISAKERKSLAPTRPGSIYTYTRTNK